MTVYNRCLVARRRTTTTTIATIITTVAARKDLIFRPRIDIGSRAGRDAAVKKAEKAARCIAAKKKKQQRRVYHAQLIENYLSNLKPSAARGAMPASRCIVRIAYERIPFGHSPSCHHHPPRLTTPSPLRLTGAHGYIRLEIKSAIVSPLNELSHAYAYSRSSARVCVYSRPVRLLHARTSLVRARAREYIYVCAQRP